MEVGATEDYEFDFSAMFDRVDHPARGRQGGGNGAAMTISRSDGTAMKGKGKQFVAAGDRVMLAMPGGAGYGDVADRDPALIKKDLIRGYISEAIAMQDYDMSEAEVRDAIAKNDTE